MMILFLQNTWLKINKNKLHKEIKKQPSYKQTSFAIKNKTILIMLKIWLKNNLLLKFNKLVNKSKNMINNKVLKVSI